MRSAATVEQRQIDKIKQAVYYETEGKGLERIAARLTIDRNIIDVRKDRDISSLRNVLEHDYLPHILFIDDDFLQAKKLCYDIAKLAEVEYWAHKDSLTHPLCAVVDSHIRATFVLFSDHRPLISKFLEFDFAMYGDTEKDIRSRWHMAQHLPILLSGYAIYALANGDFERVSRCVEAATRLYNKGQHKGAHLDLHINVWQAIETRDKTRLQKGLLTLIRKAHKYLNQLNYIATHFISSPAIGYLKAAWLLDLEVDVDHKYIPMELMPYQPLPIYEKRFWFMLDE